jgi:undecaprenyl-diphosphatase
MSWFCALILGILQGITEFLPVSSSAHFAIGSALFGLTDPEANLAFNVFLHFASLLAILVVFFDEIKDLIFGFKTKTILWIIIATIPAAILGFAFKDMVSSLFTSQRLYLVGIALIINGFVLLIGENSGWGMTNFNLEKVGAKNSLIIGLIQAIAIIPGISRSGSTISGGLLAGLDKRSAVKFSFFLAIPVIMGASVLELKDFAKISASFQLEPILIGGIASFLTSIIAIYILIQIVSKSRLYYFSIYCFLLGAGILIAKIF